MLLQAEPVSGYRLVSDLLRTEGVAALWKGNVPAEILYVLYGASQFTAYSELNRLLCTVQENARVALHPQLHLFVVGCGSGAVSTLVSYPFDLLRTRLAASSSVEFLSMSKTASEIYQHHGVLGFFAGIRPSMLSIVASSGCFFCLYSLARDFARVVSARYNKQLYAVEAACGFMAGATSKAVTFPLDTIRKRLQVSENRSAWRMLLSHFQLHGLRGFYRGFGVSLVKTAPTSAISVSAYEYALRMTERASLVLR